MRPIVRITATALAFAATLGAAVRAAGSDPSLSIDVGGVARTYRLHVPSGLAGRVPLVLAFHGHGGDGAGEARLSGLDALADRYGFIVAYPDGLNRGWNDGRGGARNTADDLGFAAALQDALERRYPIDAKRVYATGMSNGAVFSNYLACEQSDRIAAVAPVSGTMAVAVEPNCRPKRAVSFLEIDGTNDPIMPFGGGAIHLGRKVTGDVLSADATAAFWARNAGCAAPPESLALPPIAPPDGTSVTRKLYAGCTPGSGVVQYVVAGGGHTWPSGPQYLPRWLIGASSDQMNASATIVQFFLAHPMR